MKLSLNWLKDYVQTNNISAKEIADNLTMSGSKVETIINDGGKINNIVVGKVLNIKKHENAEKLVMCEVLIEKDKTVNIITGAKNVLVNSFVAVCLNNSSLFDGKIIKNQKLRGVMSYGMMCSLEELGLCLADFPYAIEDGIFLIEEACKVGQDIKSVVGYDDVILDFEITSNRPDCLSVYGLAREVAACFSLELKKLQYFDFEETKNKKSEIEVEIKTKLCKRYMAQLVSDVKIAPSPFWLRSRLRKMGIKPINNIVDITNYVMIELGVPMHAFDADRIKNFHIEIRTAKENEKINTLDDLTHCLEGEEILVCNENEPIAIAGIIGGKEHSVSNETKNVIFEVACFEGESVRKTSKNLKIRTESAIRFEKNLNPEFCEETLKRACALVLKLNAGTITKAVVDVKNFEKNEETIDLDVEYINNFLGLEISQDKMEQILISLGFEINDKKIKTPNFRVDIKNKADIAEEIARIYGYSKIPCVMPSSNSLEFGFTYEQKLEQKIKNVATAVGLFEICSFSIVNPKLFEKMELEKEEIYKNSITIKNPFGEEKSLMRKFLMPSMLETLSYNFRNKNEKAALFEIGTTYKDMDGKIVEKKQISIGMFNSGDFFTLKGIITTILNKVGIFNVEFKTSSKNPFNPFACCEIFSNEKFLGVFGEIKPNICENFKIFEKTYVAELEYDEIVQNSNEKNKYVKISKFPALIRDLCFVCDEDLSYITIENVIKKNIGGVLEKIEVFDVYRGAQIEKGKKSISLKITMRGKEKTLKDDEVETKIKKAIKKLEEINVLLRKI